MSFYPALITHIIESPMVYLPNRDLSCLQAFLIGHDSILAILGFNGIAGWIPQEFNDWIEHKYGLKTSENAPGILSLVANNDAEAFDLFGVEFRAFVAHHGIIDEPVNYAQVATKPIPEVIDLTDSLFGVKKRFTFVLRRKSVILLRAFADGMRLAIRFACSDREVKPNLDEFEKWLSHERNLDRLFRWDRVLLFNCGGDEALAFDLFFDRLQAYTASHR